MGFEKVKSYLNSLGCKGKALEFETSSATVELAAQAVGVIPARIAKTLSFKRGEGCILVVAAGDARIDNTKFKAAFGLKAKMLTADEVIHFTGHAVGGVCPFAIESSQVEIFLDQSLKRFSTVYPACGSSNSAIELTCEELFLYAKASEWVDVCKDWQESE